jgi:tetratricopeptide (TPR) repeat protein
MRTLIAIVLLVAAGLLGVLGWQWVAGRAASSAEVASPARVTAADRRIRKAETIIKLGSAKHDGYNLLAAAYLQKARETGDFTFNLKAEQAVNQSLEILDNVDGLVLKARVLLAYHRFEEALQLARKVMDRRNDNPDAWLVAADAQVELGDYQGAVESAQRAMDVRPDMAAYARAAHIRALHGDVEGAVIAMQSALKAANPLDGEAVAWCRLQLSNQLLALGRMQEAEREADHALEAFPGFHLAYAMKARVRAAANDHTGAVDLYRSAVNRVPASDSAAALGDLLLLLGKEAEAMREFELLEFIETEGKASTESFSPQLAMSWADRGHRLDEALEVAQRERAMRSDIYTCDLLAWSLFKKGRLEEARVAIKEALRLGTPDARILFHAGMIYSALGDRELARTCLRRALEVGTSFDNNKASFTAFQASTARRMLETLG